MPVYKTTNAIIFLIPASGMSISVFSKEVLVRKRAIYLYGRHLHAAAERA
jgi:hypothetical protein